MTSHAKTCAAVVLLLLGGCTHGRPAPAAATPQAPVYWPAPPAPPRVRLVLELPDPDAPPPERAWWRIALDWITGAGSQGDGPLLSRPFGLAFMKDGSLWVADPDGAKVVRFDLRGTPTLVTCPDAAWGAPMALAQGLGSDDAVYVADAVGGTVIRWTSGGCSTLGAGLLERPTGVATTSLGVWIADPPRHRVLVLSPTGNEVARIGGRGDGDGAFNFPSSLAALSDGRMAVVDALNFRVVLLSPEARWLRSFGERGDEGGQLSLPKAVGVDPDGSLFVSDAQRDRVLVLGEDGSYRYSMGETGTGPGQFTHPAGVALSGARIAVADSYNHRVQVFESLGGTP